MTMLIIIFIFITFIILLSFIFQFIDKLRSPKIGDVYINKIDNYKIEIVSCAKGNLDEYRIEFKPLNLKEVVQAEVKRIQYDKNDNISPYCDLYWILQSNEGSIWTVWGLDNFLKKYEKIKEPI